MQVLLSTLPKSGWWANGMPQYTDNPFMKKGTVPNLKLVEQEWQNLKNTIQKYANLTLVPFPDALDKPGNYKHDFVFVRDSFVSHKSRKIILANFAEKSRKQEVVYIEQFLQNTFSNHKIYKLEKNEFIEGGEFIYLPHENIGIFGQSRANVAGIKKVATIFNLDRYFIVKSKGFHLDTVMSVPLSRNGKAGLILVSLDNIKNKQAVLEIGKYLKKPIVDVGQEYSIGDGKSLGNMAVNGLSLPGVFVSSFKFSDSVEEKIRNLQIQHIIANVSEFHKSGGSVHCLTNQVWNA